MSSGSGQQVQHVIRGCSGGARADVGAVHHHCDKEREPRIVRRQLLAECDEGSRRDLGDDGALEWSSMGRYDTQRTQSQVGVGGVAEEGDEEFGGASGREGEGGRWTEGARKGGKGRTRFSYSLGTTPAVRSPARTNLSRRTRSLHMSVSRIVRAEANFSSLVEYSGRMEAETVSKFCVMWVNDEPGGVQRVSDALRPSLTLCIHLSPFAKSWRSVASLC